MITSIINKNKENKYRKLKKTKEEGRPHY